MMRDLSADQLGTLITLGAAAVGSLLVIIVNCIHGSKCKTIKCCGMQCEREITTEVEPEPEPELPPNNP
jgi:hypothetical protein